MHCFPRDSYVLAQFNKAISGASGSSPEGAGNFRQSLLAALYFAFGRSVSTGEPLSTGTRNISSHSQVFCRRHGQNTY